MPVGVQHFTSLHFTGRGCALDPSNWLPWLLVSYMCRPHGGSHPPVALWVDGPRGAPHIGIRSRRAETRRPRADPRGVISALRPPWRGVEISDPQREGTRVASITDRSRAWRDRHLLAIYYA